MPRQGIGTLPVLPKSLDDAVVIVDNDTYNIADLELHDSQGVVRMTISRTILHGRKQTRGHHHPHDNELYYFAEGEGIFMLNNDAKMVQAGNYMMVERDVWHKVINTSASDMVFIAYYPAHSARPAFVNK
jgi:quercetin dioxygenase-like cupin family protein